LKRFKFILLKLYLLWRGSIAAKNSGFLALLFSIIQVFLGTLILVLSAFDRVIIELKNLFVKCSKNALTSSFALKIILKNFLWGLI